MKTLALAAVLAALPCLAPGASAAPPGIVWYAIDYPANTPGYRFITDTLGAPRTLTPPPPRHPRRA